MIGRLILVGFVASGVALAQLQLFLIDAPGSEQPVVGQFDVGSVPSGDIRDTKFRIRNLGATAATLERLRVLGDRFWLEGHLSTPHIIAPGSNVDFRVRFHPLAFGAYSASLRINDTITIILGSSPRSVTIAVEDDGEFRLLSSGETVLFGRVERGASVAQRFRLANPADVGLTVSSLAVAGEPFQAAGLPSAPVVLEPGEFVLFVVSYEPRTAGLHQGTLTMEERSFVLEGVGVDPPFPAPEILLEAASLESGRQSQVSVRLASPPVASGTGELRMEFHPAMEGAGDDPAIQFLANGGRTIALGVREGETATQLGGEAAAVFQTGTTAGTITFTVELGARLEQAAVTIPPSPVVVDSGDGRRTTTGLELRIVGFDNSQSVSWIAFTFFDTRGGELTAEPIRADVGGAFREHFQSAQLGGLFSLIATFPVAGDPGLIGAVDVEFTNNVGPSGTRRITF